MKTLLALALLISLLLSVAACTSNGSGNSDENSSSNSGQPGGEKTSLAEGTFSTGENTTESTISFEETTGQSDRQRVVLRLEGDPKTRFSGICRDGEDETVLNGKVPKRFDYDLDSGTLSCRIQKRDSGGGNLKVTLVADNATRSVQQTNTRGSTIKISYQAEG